jgi:SAM-dependent methyltransferase
MMNWQWNAGRTTARNIVRLLKNQGVEKGRLLEVGCGNGRISIPLAKRGFAVTGVDFSPVFIDDARRRARKSRVGADFVVGDMRRLKSAVRGRFDVALSIWTAIGYYDKKTDKRILAQIVRLLKPKGLLLILQTMSQEYLSSHYCPTNYDETDRYIVLHKGSKFDRFHSYDQETWVYYQKVGKDLKYLDEFEVKLKIYSLNELVEMGEDSGLEFVAAYDNLATFEPARADSHINLVFRKS